jgi:hypothetical protein
VQNEYSFRSQYASDFFEKSRGLADSPAGSVTYIGQVRIPFGASECCLASRHQVDGLGFDGASEVDHRDAEHDGAR